MKQVEDRISEDLRAQATNLKTAAFVEGIVFALLGLALAIAGCGLLFMIVRNILGAIGSLTDTMATLANGDKTVDITGIERGDEIGQMAEAVLVFKENMIRNDELDAEQKQERAAREARAQKVEQAGLMIAIQFLQTDLLLNLYVHSYFYK